MLKGRIFLGQGGKGVEEHLDIRESMDPDGMNLQVLRDLVDTIPEAAHH